MVGRVGVVQERDPIERMRKLLLSREILTVAEMKVRRPLPFPSLSKISFIKKKFFCQRLNEESISPDHHGFRMFWGLDWSEAQGFGVLSFWNLKALGVSSFWNLKVWGFLVFGL